MKNKKRGSMLQESIQTMKMDIANLAPTTQQIITGNEPYVNFQAMLGIMKRDSSIASTELSKPISKALSMKALLIITKYKTGQSTLDKSLDKFVNLIEKNIISSSFKFDQQTITKLRAYFLQIGSDNYIKEVVDKLQKKAEKRGDIRNKVELLEELTTQDMKEIRSMVEELITNLFYKIYTRSNFLLK